MDSKFYIVCLLLLFLGGVPTTFSQVIFEDDFESGKFKDEWVATPGAENGVVSVSSTIGSRNVFNKGTYGVGVGKNSSSGGLLTNMLELKLDLSGYEELELSFYLLNNNDATHPEDGLYFSDDGGANYKKVMDFDLSNWASSIYSKLPPIDIDRLAKHYGLSLSADFIIKFQQRGSGVISSIYSGSRDGFFIDDVTVKVPDQTYISTYPYQTSFEGSFDLPAGWKHVNPNFPYIDSDLSTSTASIQEESTVRLEGLVQVGSTIQGRNVFKNGQNGLVLGKRVGGKLNANAVDLHLDLSGVTEVELLFWMLSLNEETHPYDGIYFSDNAGVSFKKVMDFDFSNWASFEWGQIPPLDIDRLAKHYGLSLNSKFVIRFQQYGNQSFGSIYSGSRDGIFIDDVEVRVPDQTYISTFPYKTGFEGSFNLPSGWKHTNPTFPYINADLASSTALEIGESTVRLEGLVQVGSTIQGRNVFKNGQNGLVLGKRVGGKLNANAVDLHLDLSGVTEVELLFWMLSLNEETHPYDGIYFSDNAGVSFKKVMDFDFSNWASFEWGQIPPLDIDRLAKHYGLSLNSKFVIRFQQYGNQSFGSIYSGNRDGIFIDDVEVRVPDQTFIKDFPYNEGFEAGTELPKGWAYSNPTFPYVDPLSDFSTGIIDNKSTVRLEGGVGVTDKYQSLTVSKTGENGLYLGKRASGQYGVVSVDLKLDLKEAQNVILKFWVFGNNEELHPQDGIFLSINAGLTFTKIQDYTLNSNKWVLMEVDISTLSKDVDLVLSENTVVRFQQYGKSAIYKGTSNRDGIFLDDIEITTKIKTSQTLSFPALPDMQFGDAPFDLVATADSELPVQFTVVSGPATITGQQLTITGTGTVKIKAEQAGDNEWEAADAIEQSFKVEKANQEISFGSISKKTYGDPSFTLVATADSKLPVAFSLVGGPGILSGSKVTITGAGTITVKATQAGNDNYNATSEEKQVTVEKAGQTITFANLPEKTFGDQPVDLSASSSSGLPVTFSIKSGPGSLSGDALSLDGAGAIVVTASQPGNDNYKEASEVNRTQTVKKKSQTIDFTAIEDKTVDSAPFDLIASSSSNLEVTYKVISGPATVSGKIVTLTGAGKVVVEANQNGNDNYNAAEKKTNSFCVAPPLPEIEIVGSEFSPELFLKVNNAPAGSTYQWQIAGVEIPGANQSEISLTDGGAYTVIVTVNDCSVVSEPQTLTALEEKPGSGALVKLFPNPARSSFSINGLTIGETYELAIYEINGKSRVILEYQHKENSFINLSGYNPGVYLIEIKGFRFFVVRRLIIAY